MKPSLGSKDYGQYKSDQVTRAESKWARKDVWNHGFKQRLKENWKTVKDLIDPSPIEICCMGSRDGTELFEFKSYYPKALVTGVDLTKNISTIRLIPGIQVKLEDFNDLPEGWEGRFDLVFSNSLDHAYDPYETVKEWHRVCRGFIFVELATANKPNVIEHCFELADVDKLFPPELFEHLMVWESKTEDKIVGLFKVKKREPYQDALNKLQRS